MPQTAAPLAGRIEAIEALCKRFPSIGWQICIEQFHGGLRSGHFSARPRWRNDAAGAGQPVTDEQERSEFRRKLLDLAISWPTHSADTLGDLVDVIGDLPEKDRQSVWKTINEWSQAETDEGSKAILRERIRLVVLTRPLRLGGIGAEHRDIAKEIYDRLAPRDAVLRHKWLFAKAWVAGIELADEHLDLNRREAWISQLRSDAMSDLWSVQGIEGVRRLLADCDTWTLGRYTALQVTDQRQKADVLRDILSNSVDSRARVDNFVHGFLIACDQEARGALVAVVVHSFPVEHAARFLACLPFSRTTWRLLDQYEQSLQDQYWRETNPEPAQFTESETNEIIDRLLEAKRPRAAFFAVRFDWNRVETSRLKRLLMAVASENAEPPSVFRIDSYDASEALASLDGRPTVTVDEMAQLEFAFIVALDQMDRGIPNVERRVTESPVFFVHVLALFCKRRGEGQDPPEWQVEDTNRRDTLAHAAYRLLGQLKRVPGTNVDGKVEPGVLRDWIVEARRLCAEHGRAAIGDQQIGELLSNAPSDEDGLWPCRAVCEAIEEAASEHVATGFTIGVLKARGFHMRGMDEGGQQERELAAQNRLTADRLAFDYPHVATILEGIAEHYDRDAARQDAEVLVRRRLEH